MDLAGHRARGAIIGVTSVILTAIRARCSEIPGPPIGGTGLDLICPDALRIARVAAVTIARRLVG